MDPGLHKIHNAFAYVISFGRVLNQVNKVIRGGIANIHYLGRGGANDDYHEKKVEIGTKKRYPGQLDALWPVG